MIEHMFSSLPAVIRRALLSGLPLLLLAGCAATEIGQRQVYVPPSGPDVTTQPDKSLAPFSPQALPEVAPSTPQPVVDYPRTIDDTQASSAIMALYHQAQQDRGAGKLDAASNDLERAMRLDPRNAFLWNALASLHLQQQQSQQAESEASKSNSLAGGNPYLEASNWRVIAAARQAQGNAAGALQAQAQAEQALQGQP